MRPLHRVSRITDIKSLLTSNLSFLTGEKHVTDCQNLWILCHHNYSVCGKVKSLHKTVTCVSEKVVFPSSAQVQARAGQSWPYSQLNPV